MFYPLSGRAKGLLSPSARWPPSVWILKSRNSRRCPALLMGTSAVG